MPLPHRRLAPRAPILRFRTEGWRAGLSNTGWVTLQRTRRAKTQVHAMFDQYMAGNLITLPRGTTPRQMAEVKVLIKKDIVHRYELTYDGSFKAAYTMPLAALVGGSIFSKWEDPFMDEAPVTFSTLTEIAELEDKYSKKYSWAKTGEIYDSDAQVIGQELTNSEPEVREGSDARPNYVNSGSALFRSMNRGY